MKHLAPAVFLLAGCHHGGETAGETADDAVSVVCAPAIAGHVDDRVSLRGVLGVPPDRDAVVSPVIAGRIAEILVRESDSVTKGQSLARIDNPEVASGLAEADAAVASASAKADKAKTALERVTRLFDEGVTAKREVDDARAESAAADAELSTAKAKLIAAQAAVAHARVPSPIDGQVMHVFRRVGELVDGTPATPVAEVADAAMLELVADVPAVDLVRIPERAPAQVSLDALPGVDLAGAIRTVSPSVDPATSMGTVRVSIAADPATRARLRLGLAGRASVVLGARDAVILVPAVAVRRSSTSEDEVVLCAEDDGKTVARVRTVKLGARNGDAVEIAAGVAAGDRVVVRHVLGLEDGTALAPAESAPRANGSPAP